MSPRQNAVWLRSLVRASAEALPGSVRVWRLKVSGPTSCLSHNEKEFVAGLQLGHEGGGPGVAWIGRRPQCRDRLFGDVRPIREQAAGGGVEEDTAHQIAAGVTILEPGPYGTDWAGASAAHTTPIAAYEPIREAAGRDGMTGQPSDALAARSSSRAFKR